MNLTQFFHDVVDSKPVLVIPKLSEMRQDGYRPDFVRKIAAQLETAARQLATANFWLWPRRCMAPAIERWDDQQLRFVGLSLTDFCIAIEGTFRVCTEDGSQWRLDRVIGNRLWAAAIQPGVLPLANYDVELAKRREAEDRKRKNAAK
jgi:hypothetical protein